ncbi:hypothetical protein ACTWQF_34280 [Streptomyces sp. 8N114]|uniref:hypothetical protein n=1 Tax=Streptomyces sp. 8N114 TaxID=3457419 RepID=UPI003FD3E71F
MSAGPDAVEVRPWWPGEPEPVYRYYPHPRPVLSIRVHGRWTPAVVQSREDHPDGRVIYHVEISLTVDGVRGTFEVRYLWDPATMHPAPPVRGALGS